MKTVTYAEILYQAAEAAGRTRDKIPTKEALMLQNFLATGLREIWNANFQWPELIPAITSTAAAAGSFSKNEGTANELGDILGVWTANPQTTTRYLALRFEERDGVVFLPDGGQTLVWVEYMLPCPNLTELSGQTLLDYTLPARLRNYLAFSAAGNLLRSDGQIAHGNEMFDLAKRDLAIEAARVAPVPRRAVRPRNIYAAEMHVQPPANATT